MKKIGIMTMQRINNYGSYMQALGLKNIISSLGYNVIFVDYEPGEVITQKKEMNKMKKIFSKINLVNSIKRKIVLNKYINLFSKQYIPRLCGDKFNFYPNDIDELIIGSDEVFNCMQEYPVGFSKNLFGVGYENIPVISYAASFGQTSLQKLEKYDISDEIASYLRKFKSISVRDKNSYEIVKKLLRKEPNLNLDPVLISDYPNLINLNVPYDNYIIIYAYPDRLTKEEKKTIKKFAKQHRKKIMSFGMFQEIADIEITVDPLTIFSYFKKADFIITDTFHGSIFSIKNGKNFCTIVRQGLEGNSNKLTDLLLRLQLSDRIIDDLSNLEILYNKNIDYSKTNQIILDEKAKSIDYLKKELINND